MRLTDDIKKPSKQEQEIALESYETLSSVLDGVDSETAEVTIDETNERIRVPLHALKLLARILEVTSQGTPISIVPIATELTTQAAAELLGCSRPHLVKLLESGKIPFTKVGKHRRVLYEDVANYKKLLKAEQERLLVEIMEADEQSGLYDS